MQAVATKLGELFPIKHGDLTKQNGDLPSGFQPYFLKKTSPFGATVTANTPQE
jgi:hypothetical protein